MGKKLRILSLLMLFGCTHTATIKEPIYRPLVKGEPLSDDALNHIRERSPKDAVFADLLQAFAMMRTLDLNKSSVRKDILGLLSTSVNSFEDLSDPVNFSEAFSADESKSFRGRPHERMFAATMAGVFLMAEDKCDRALPYLRNAEFLDARFQKMPFGTDAPLIYALMYRCLYQKNTDQDAIIRAAQGVFRSIRFLTMQETFIKALVDMSVADMRPMAVTNRMAYMLYEVSIYHSLLSAKDDATPEQLVDDAAKNTSLFIATLKDNFADEYQARMRPAVLELGKVYNLDEKGINNLEEVSFDRIILEADTIGRNLKKVLSKHAWFRKEIEEASRKTQKLTSEILHAAKASKMILSFSGYGPSLLREGSYDEISVIKPSEDASTRPNIRERDLKLSTTCGFHRLSDGGFSIVMCKDNSIGPVESLPSLELLSLSRKASSAQGRKFDKVLKGRAQFRAATEDISKVTAWSALFLFYLGAELIADCNRRNESQACYASGLVVWTLALATGLFSGTVWLIGKSVNPSADSRFIHLMYESAWLSI